LTTAAFLALGIPLFLQMPIWCDATLYDVSARSMLAGGVHYRDVFDTNPPGFPWLLVVVRVLFGTSSFALRAVDLVIALTVAAMLLRWVRASGASSAGTAWLAASLAAFYPFLYEFIHVQRDVWMMLPALAAIRMRLGRIERSAHSTVSPVVEGLVWGVGVWIKPHLLLIAVSVWLFSANRLGSVRRAIVDLALVMCGGMAAGLLGLGLLMESGAWPYFLDVWKNWNPAYTRMVFEELRYRILAQQLDYFPPYSCCAILAMPLVMRNFRDRTSADSVTFSRAVLACTYFSWLAFTLLLQRGFHYTHVPETLLMLGLFAANRWPIPAVLLLVQALTGAYLLAVERTPDLREFHERARSTNLVYKYLTVRNSAFDLERDRWWSECFTLHPSRQVQKGVALWDFHFGEADPVELGAVADFLREQKVKDRELIAWHDSPHALYLDLGIQPGFRFMHVTMAYSFGDWQREQILRELQAEAPHARFAVSDLHRLTKRHKQLNELDPDGLPHVLPLWQRQEFPFNQPVVFRSPSGRYLVHAIKNSVTSCRIAGHLDQADPPK
jgi:hypothetical protein